MRFFSRTYVEVGATASRDGVALSRVAYYPVKKMSRGLARKTGGITAGTVEPARLAAPRDAPLTSHQFLIAEKNPVMGLSIALSARRGAAPSV
ncbi:hypothetical protein [Burkholderia ambifaria]|uniref:hypothetical protein n=1 Tax=Burkholderia ambifaria TaxID=152480 RepID=UPI00158B6727|nr:hypothetical protein [Burkholderia ambifaria]